MKIHKLNFQPFPGIASTHLQTIITSLLSPGNPPPSKQWLVDLGNDDCLSCEVSIPPHWKQSDQTVVLIHGMGGSHASGYMVRMAKKLYFKGSKVVRINLRGCGSGKGHSKLLYHAGTSNDILQVLQCLKKIAPISEVVLIGFSLGGNITLKLAGELGIEATALVKTFIAVCPPLDLAQTVGSLQETRNRFYELYYLKKVKSQAAAHAKEKFRNIHTLFEFDDVITAPAWGYKGASEYYEDCSSVRFLPYIKQSTHLLFAQDDPFICLDRLQGVSLPDTLHIWVTERGGHMGFLGTTAQKRSFYWMDDLLLNWVL
jgi:predicted alpha/beta-fold hydrolase